MEVWLDGKVCATHPYHGAPWFSPLTALNRMYLGCNASMGCMHGTLDEFRISKVQRTFTAGGPYVPVRLVPSFSVRGSDGA